MAEYENGQCCNKVNLNLLNLQDIVEILANEEIIFKAEIVYLGEDTNFKCVEFNLYSKEYYSFDYYLDLDIHGHTIHGGINQWFYSPKDKLEFLELIKTGGIVEAD